MNKRLLIRWFQLFGAMALICVLRPGLSHAERVKDMATVAGVRTNQIVGYGLVVGLNGTGDQTTQAPFTVQSISNMLAKFGVTIPASVASQMQLKNVAAVTVTAELPAFVKTGQTIDITVASIANATSLRGGALLMARLSPELASGYARFYLRVARVAFDGDPMAAFARAFPIPKAMIESIDRQISISFGGI